MRVSSSKGRKIVASHNNIVRYWSWRGARGGLRCSERRGRKLRLERATRVWQSSPLVNHPVTVPPSEGTGLIWLLVIVRDYFRLSTILWQCLPLKEQLASHLSSDLPWMKVQDLRIISALHWENTNNVMWEWIFLSTVFNILRPECLTSVRRTDGHNSPYLFQLLLDALVVLPSGSQLNIATLFNIFHVIRQTVCLIPAPDINIPGDGW